MSALPKLGRSHSPTMLTITCKIYVQTTLYVSMPSLHKHANQLPDLQLSRSRSPKMLSIQLIFNLRRACAARVMVCHSVCFSVRPSVCLSVCYHVFCHHAQQTSQKVTPTSSMLHWLHFQDGDCRKSAAFKSYCVITKSTNQYAN